MRCEDIGLLKAYTDGELTEEDKLSISEHVKSCQRCRFMLEEMQHSSEIVHARLSRLMGEEEELTPPAQALADFRIKLAQSKQQGGSKYWEKARRAVASVFAARRRTALAGVAVFICLGLLFAFTPVRSAAEDLLAIFRVQKFTAVTVIPAELPELPGGDDPSVFGTAKLQDTIEHHPVADIAQASAEVDFTVRLPSRLPPDISDTPEIVVMESSSFEYIFDLTKMRDYLRQAGLEDVAISETLDGATVRLNVPPFVMMGYNDVATASGTDRASLILFQGKSPTVEATGTLDIETLRQQVLTIYAMYSPQSAAQLRAIDDWHNTLVVPVPPGIVHNAVTVDGVQGLALESTENHQTALLWQKDGVIYGLSGAFATDSLVEIGNSLK